MISRSRFLIVFSAGLLWSTLASAAENPQVIFQRLCAQCHGTDGGGDKSIEAPAIAGLPDWYVERQLHNFRKGIRGTHPLDIAGTRMAPMARYFRNDEDLTAVAKYAAALPAVKQTRTVQGSIVKGEARYQICAACHGADGQGNKDTNGPKLAGSSDWYLLTQLKNFKSGARGGNPEKDPISAAMVPNAMMLDDQGMLDVVSYINTLSGK